MAQDILGSENKLEVVGCVYELLGNRKIAKTPIPFFAIGPHDGFTTFLWRPQ